jgi:SnoaL-like domain
VSALVAPDFVYRLEQTRERIVGRDRFMAFNREYPGDWEVTVHKVVADDESAVSWIRLRLGEETVSALSVFTFDADGLITAVDEFWPEAYEPPGGREHLVERY